MIFFVERKQVDASFLSNIYYVQRRSFPLCSRLRTKRRIYAFIVISRLCTLVRSWEMRKCKTAQGIRLYAYYYADAYAHLRKISKAKYKHPVVETNCLVSTCSVRRVSFKKMWTCVNVFQPSGCRFWSAGQLINCVRRKVPDLTRIN